jgi:hypothetical protein
MLEVEYMYNRMNKHEKIRVEQWSKKLCEVLTNKVWKKFRNEISDLLVCQLRKGTLQEPFKKVPPDGPLTALPKYKLIGATKERNSKARPVEVIEAYDKLMRNQKLK